MCIFIYTLPQKCGHKFFQNISECPIARGIEPTTENRLDATLSKTKFLFDTSRSRTRTPEAYSRDFACKKRKAIRPVPTFCDECIRNARKKKEQREEGERQERRTGNCLMVPPRCDGMVGRSESSGSAVALMGAGAGKLGTSSTMSSLQDASGTSTPKSFGKTVRPSEMI